MIRTADKRKAGEGILEEPEYECPLFAPIPTEKPTDKEMISLDDIHVGSNRSVKQQEELFTLIMENISAFSKGGHLGKISGARATINIEGGLPAPQGPRPTGPEERKVIEETIDQLLAWDMIEELNLETASPVVLVRKTYIFLTYIFSLS